MDATPASQPPPSLRDRQRQLSSRVIVDAVAALIVERGISEFSMQDVADRAGVSIRTLYRHFATRDALIDGISDEIDRRFDGRDVAPPERLEDLESLAAVYDVFDEEATLVRALVIATLGAGRGFGSRPQRDVALVKLLDDVAGDLDDANRRALFAIVRYLWGSLAWTVTTRDLGLSSDEASQLIGWALRTLLSAAAEGSTPIETE